MERIQQLPDDIKCKILSFVDLDTRQKAGIILKLDVPEETRHNLAKINNTNIQKSRLKSYIKLGNDMYYLVRHFGTLNRTYFVVVSGNKKDDKSFYRVPSFDVI